MHLRNLWAFPALLTGMFLVGCNCCQIDDQPAPTAAVQAETEAECCTACCGEKDRAHFITALADAAEKDWSTIKGQVVFAGDKLPEAAELKIDKDQDHCLAKGKILNEEWVVNKTNKGVKNVFVWLAPDPAGAVKTLPIHASLKDLKDKKVEIDQPNCAFIPHALAMREGQVLVAKNSSPIAHNVNATGYPTKNPARNILVPAKSQIELEGLRADEWPVSVACNIHPWMKAWVRIYDHPYFAVTDENGNFEIKLAPAGKWRLRAWHDTGYRGGKEGKAGQEIEVKGGQVTDLGKLEMKPN